MTSAHFVSCPDLDPRARHAAELPGSSGDVAVGTFHRGIYMYRHGGRSLRFLGTAYELIELESLLDERMFWQMDGDALSEEELGFLASLSAWPKAQHSSVFRFFASARGFSSPPSSAPPPLPLGFFDGLGEQDGGRWSDAADGMTDGR